MALADAVQGAKRPSQQITWTDEDGNALDLSGATITGRIRDETTGIARDIDGTLAIVTAASGIFSWDYGTQDVGTAGTFAVQFIATYGSNPTPAKSFTSSWIVRDII